MKQLFFLLSILFSFNTFIDAQILFSGTRGAIGNMELNDCSYQFYGLPSFFFSNHDYRDVTLTPDGRLLAISSYHNPGLDINETYLIEINTDNVLDSDTIFVLDGYSKGALICSSDYMLYLGGSGIHTYSLLTHDLSYLGSNPGLRWSGGLAWYQGELYGSTFHANSLDIENFPAHFIRYGGLEDGTVATNSTFITDQLPGFAGLATIYDYENESLRLIGANGQRANISNQKDTSRVYEVFLSDTSFIQLCELALEPANRRIMGLASADQFRTNFQLQLDLDADDSSGRFIDHHQTDGLCTRSFALADEDVHIQAPATGIDSLVIVLAQGVHPNGEETIHLSASSDFQLIGNGTAQLSIIPELPNDLPALAALISSAQLQIAGDELQTGERRVDFRLYSNGVASDVAMAYVYPQPDIIPYPGENYEVGACAIDLVNLFDGLGEAVYPDGYWSPALRDSGHVYSTGFSEPGTFYYIVQEGSCGPDTATVTVTEFPQLLYNYGGTSTDIQDLYLCPGDTVNWSFDPDVLLDWEWTQAPFYDTLTTITSPDIYGIIAIDTNGCDYYLRTLFREPFWEEIGPGSLLDTVTRCEGKTLYFFNNPVSSDTTICNVIPSTSDCEFTHCRTFQFTPGIETFTEAEICEGESYSWYQQEYTAMGNYQEIIEVVLPDCDTIANLTLSVDPTYERNLIANLIPGGSFTVGDSVLTAPGLYSILLQTQQGCDSLINLELELINSNTDPLTQHCSLPNLLRKGQNDWQISCAADLYLKSWTLLDAQGRQVYHSSAKPVRSNVLLSSQQQQQLSAGVYFYHIAYEWAGELAYSQGKLVLLE